MMLTAMLRQPQPGNVQPGQVLVTCVAVDGPRAGKMRSRDDRTDAIVLQCPQAGTRLFERLRAVIHVRHEMIVKIDDLHSTCRIAASGGALSRAATSVPAQRKPTYCVNGP